ncbi:CaiB/BaiF CoA transferase family protein [Arthrobacter pigmenti]
MTALESDLDKRLGRTGNGPLSGIVVADFSRILAGPYCTMLLADMGATVIKVESPDGDDTRTWKPPVHGDQATYYLAVNRNKHSIALDLKDGEDLAVAQEIARRADVFIENFKPGSLARFGLDYESVRGTNPNIIYSSISGFGSGEGASLPGYDLLVQALSGLMSLTGDPDGEPYRSGLSVFDVMTGMHSGLGILAALHHRDLTGEGQNVETNLLSSALSGMVNQTSAYVAGGVVPGRMGNSHLSLFPYEPLQTKEGKIIVVAGNNRQFRTLCQVLGAPGLADDERFSSVPSRNERREELRPLLLERLAQHTAGEWFEILTEAGLPSAPIQTVKEGIELAERLGLSPVVQAGTGGSSVPTVRHPISFSATPATYDLAPPALNSSAEMLRKWLSSNSAGSGAEGLHAKGEEHEPSRP